MPASELGSERLQRPAPAPPDQTLHPDGKPYGRLDNLLGLREASLADWWPSLGRAGDLMLALLHVGDLWEVPVGEPLRISPEALGLLCGSPVRTIYRRRDVCVKAGVLSVVASRDKHECAGYLVNFEHLAQA